MVPFPGRCDGVAGMAARWADGQTLYGMASEAPSPENGVHYIGIDVGKKESFFFAVDDHGKKLSSGWFPSSGEAAAEIVAKYESLAEGVEVAIEAGNSTFMLARAMVAAGADVFVIHPLDNALIAQSRKKTDKADAKTLANQRRLGILPEHSVYVPSEAAEDLRHLITTRESRVGHRTRLINQTLAILSRYNILITKRALKSSVHWKGLREFLPQLRSADRLVVRQNIKSAVEQNEQIARLEKEMEAMVSKHFAKETELLRSIPGVGQMTSTALIAWGAPIDRFPSARQFTAYVGLAPSIRQTGGPTKMGITGGVRGGGNRHLGGLLTQAALVFSRTQDSESELFAWYEEVKQRRGWKKARIALARKLAAVAYGVLKHQQAYDPTHVAKAKASPRQHA